MSDCICPTHHQVDKDGYPKVKYNKRFQAVSRVLYQLIYGAIPAGGFICHHCDNPACVNPDHLYLGDVKTNTLDKINRKRVAGENNPNAKRSNQDCENMYNYYHNCGLTQVAIGKIYNITQSRVSECIKRAKELYNDR